MFPNDAKTFFYDSHSGDGTSGVLLSPVNYNRTILYTKLACSSGGDDHIIIGTNVNQPNNNNITDTEGSTGNNTDTFMTRLLPSNTQLTWEKSSNTKKCNYTIIYTDYDLTSYGSGYPAFFSGDGLFSSFLLLILVVFGVIYFVWNGIKAVSIHKNLTITHFKEGTEHIDL